MNYKKIIKSRERRQKILNLFSWVPDKTMIRLQYRIKTGRKLNLENPTRFTEKLQWYKLYYKNPLMIQCCDKYDVRKYVEEKGLKSILNKCYGVYEKPDEINFNSLPSQFVLKDTLGGGGNSIIICNDKDSFDYYKAIAEMNKWINTKGKASGGREWPYYSGKKHRIIIEQSLMQNAGEQPTDYKMYCFNGKYRFMHMRVGYKSAHEATAFFDSNFNRMNVSMNYTNEYVGNVCLPTCVEKMKKYAEVLSQDFPHARVDFYYVNNYIVFGEITFYHASGYTSFEPDEFDFKLGDEFICKKLLSPLTQGSCHPYPMLI